MEDQSDLLEQLTQLHAQGLLTDAEYEDKKAALRSRGQASNPPSSADQPREDVAKSLDGNRRKTPSRFLMSFIVIIVIVGYLLTKTSIIKLGTKGASAFDIKGESGPWLVESKKDPMTDEAVKYAHATFEGQRFNIEVEVSCTNTGTLSYSATSYDKEGKPAEMRNPHWDGGYPTYTHQARADNGEPFPILSLNSQYNNQIVASLGSQIKLASSQKLTLQLFMLNGEETILIPQDSSGFRGVVDSCLNLHSKAVPDIPSPVAADSEAETEE